MTTETPVLARQPRTLSTLCFLRFPAAAYDLLKALDRAPVSETFPSANQVGRRPSQHLAKESFPAIHVPSETNQAHCRRQEKTPRARWLSVPMSNCHFVTGAGVGECHLSICSGWALEVTLSASQHTPTHSSALHFCARPTPLLSPDLIRATHARPLHPAALASVPFVIVLVRVRVR